MKTCRPAQRMTRCPHLDDDGLVADGSKLVERLDESVERRRVRPDGPEDQSSDPPNSALGP